MLLSFWRRWWGLKPGPIAGWCCWVCGCVSSRCRSVWTGLTRNWSHHRMQWVLQTPAWHELPVYRRTEKVWRVLWFLLQNTGLHYDRYLREVVDYLEKDPHFKEKLQNSNMDDIKVTANSTSRHFISSVNSTCGFPACSKANFPKSWTLSTTVYGRSWTSWSGMRWTGCACSSKPSMTSRVGMVSTLHDWQTSSCTRSLEISSWVIFREELVVRQQDSWSRTRTRLVSTHVSENNWWLSGVKWVKVVFDLPSPAGHTVDHQALLKQFEHLNHKNQWTFEVEDLEGLIRSVHSPLSSSVWVSSCDDSSSQRRNIENVSHRNTLFTVSF